MMSKADRRISEKMEMKIRGNWIKIRNEEELE
jgi:hypothetical protein